MQDKPDERRRAMVWFCVVLLVAASHSFSVAQITGLRITKVLGPGALQNPVGRSFRETITLEVSDQEGRRLPGVVVVFTVPAFGASARFSRGATSVSVTTGPEGRVTLPRLTSNGVEGSYEIRASVKHQGQQASFGIEVKNVGILPPANRWWVVGGGAAAATVGIVAVAKGWIGGGKPTSRPANSVVTIGAGSLEPR